MCPVISLDTVCHCQLLDKAAAVHQALGYAPGKFTIIPNGYNIVEFTPDSEARAQLRHEWEINEQTILFGMVARYDPQKDHANLVNALRLINHKKESFQCVLVGAGMDANNHELCRLIENQGVRDKVLLLGERPDIPGVMNALDIHVLSSSVKLSPMSWPKPWPVGRLVLPLMWVMRLS